MACARAEEAALIAKTKLRRAAVMMEVPAAVRAFGVTEVAASAVVIAVVVVICTGP